MSFPEHSRGFSDVSQSPSVSLSLSPRALRDGGVCEYLSYPVQEWLRKRGAPPLVAGHSNMLACRFGWHTPAGTPFWLLHPGRNAVLAGTPRPERRFGCYTPAGTPFWLVHPGRNVVLAATPRPERRFGWYTPAGTPFWLVHPGRNAVLAATPRPERRFGCYTPAGTLFWLVHQLRVAAKPGLGKSGKLSRRHQPLCAVRGRNPCLRPVPSIRLEATKMALEPLV
eukprot:gene11239-biopygen9396